MQFVDQKLRLAGPLRLCVLAPGFGSRLSGSHLQILSQYTDSVVVVTVSMTQRGRCMTKVTPRGTLMPEQGLPAGSRLPFPGVKPCPPP